MNSTGHTSTTFPNGLPRDAADGSSLDAALDTAESKVDDLSDTITPMAERGMDRVASLANRTKDSLGDFGEVVGEKMRDVTDQVLAYTEEEPAKALLMAAGVGAALMLLLGLLARRD